MQTGIEPEESLLFEIYLREGWDDITPFRGPTVACPEGIELARATWRRLNLKECERCGEKMAIDAEPDGCRDFACPLQS